MEKIKLRQAVIVEGRDDVRAVKEACDALIIPTHGFGIARETWETAEKAYREKGLIILTDPDHAGEEIRRRMTEKFPEAIQAYIDRKDAESGEDIGVENAKPEIIAGALLKALELADRRERKSRSGHAEHSGNNQIKCDGNALSNNMDDDRYAGMSDLIELGLAAGEGSAEKRASVCKYLGIGYANASAMIGKLKGFGIDIDELKEAVEKCK